MPDKLNDNDFQEAATLLNCEVPAIKAVAEVESAGDGFLRCTKKKGAEHLVDFRHSKTDSSRLPPLPRVF